VKLLLFKEDISWLEWPKGCKEVRVLQFLCCHIDQFLRFVDKHSFYPLKRCCCITTLNKPIPSSVSKQKVDIGLVYNPNNKLEDGD